MSAGGMLAAVRSCVGMGEPNKIQAWYRQQHGSDYAGNFAWCDALITWAAHQSGNVAAVLPGGDRAFTPWHAADFQRAGRWHSGTAANVNACKPGDVIFFDWGGSNSVSAIDHVGIVEKALGGGRVQTIEGNTSDRCLRRVRSASVIAGFGRPAYSGGGSPSSSASTWMEDLMRDLPLLKKGDHGEHVQSVQGLLLARSHPEVKVDGDFGPTTEAAVKAVQKWGGVTADGEVGPNTWPVLLRVH